MTETALGYGAFDEIVAEFSDLFPQPEFLPPLTDDEVALYVALGEEGRKRFKAGEDGKALLAFDAQINILNLNAEPHVNQALIHAARGEKKEALESLRAAVVRGFTDLRRVEKAEAWTSVGRPREYLFLQDAIPVLQSFERKAVRWDSFVAYRPPDSFAAEMDRYHARVASLERAAPVLGERNTRVWRRILERESATSLDNYVTTQSDAPDVRQAVDRLLELYAGGPLRDWDALPAGTAERLGKIAEVLLTKYPDSGMQATALVGRAMSAWYDRDALGNLKKPARETIRGSLEQVVAEHPGSSLAATALVGLVRTHLATGDRDRAARAFEAFIAKRGADGDQMAIVHENLGVTALELGGLPEIAATAITGEAVGSDTLAGKVVVVDFWATWCLPCIEQFPTLRRVEEQHGEEVVMLGFNLDHAEDISGEELQAWIAQNVVPGLQIQDGLGWESRWVDRFGVKEIPFIVVVAADGEVVAINEHGKKLEKSVRKAVREAQERNVASTRP